jgi:hypothetical protein
MWKEDKKCTQHTKLNDGEHIATDVRFQVLVAASMKRTVFWDIALCSYIETE